MASVHSAVWFEIPVENMERAVQFYAQVLQIEFEVSNFDGAEMAVFPNDGPEGGDVVHGALTKVDWAKPGGDGAILYLNGGDDLAEPLSRVEAAGGKIIRPKEAIGPHGFYAVFMDTEGNRIALHSNG